MITELSLDWLGYYELGEEIIRTKKEVYARIKAGSKHQPVLNFNDAIFSCFDWTQEPDPHMTLWDYYRERAQQIRDNYDYVILQYSGGPDSTNVLEAFLRNNIKLDEIVNINSYDQTQIDQGLNNADYIHNVKPTLEQFLKRHHASQTRITIIDEIDMTKKIIQDADRQNGYSEVFQGSSVLFASAWQFRGVWVKHVEHVWRRICQGQRVCVIMGNDKTVLRVDADKRHYTYMHDLNGPDTASYFLHDRDLQRHNIVEWFYHTPDMPKLWIKQAHVLKRLVDSAKANDFDPPDKFKGTDFRPAILCESKHHPGNLRYDAYHRTVYPHWSPNIVTPKPLYYGTRVLDNWWVNQLPHEDIRAWKHSIADTIKNFKSFLNIKPNKKEIGGLPQIQTRKYYLD